MIPVGTQGLTFEVASVKANTSTDKRGRIELNLPDSFTATNLPLLSMISLFYEVPGFKMSGGPGWLSTDRFDISAKADRRITMDEKRAMLRALLEDRFKLKVHRETKEGRIYALVRARSDGALGPNLKRSQCALPCGEMGGFSLVIGKGMDMKSLAQRLEPMMATTVIDETGLDGRFDLRLTANPESLPGTPSELAKDNAAPSIFTALREQLGLKLEPRRGLLETFVIDNVEHPTSD